MSFTFRPAKTYTERKGLFVGLIGGTNSGKSFSALRLARGIAGPNGKLAALDTEGGRLLHLKESFDFDCHVMDPPFAPRRFADAAKAAEDAGYDALLIDSFSMEWVGIGGVLSWQAAEHERMGSKDSTKGASWIKPKMAHKEMVYSFLQRRIPIIFSIRGEETFVPPNTKLFKPICNKSFPFELTVSFRLEAERKGYIDLSDPATWKMEGAHQKIFQHGDRLSEEHGAALAAWARGEEPQEDPRRVAGQAAAQGGMHALQTWFKGLSREDRAEIKPYLDGTLKGMAQQADQARFDAEVSSAPPEPEQEPAAPAMTLEQAEEFLAGELAKYEVCKRRLDFDMLADGSGAEMSVLARHYPDLMRRLKDGQDACLDRISKQPTLV